VHWVFAEVAKIEITSRQVFADGMKFGNVGAYEKIKGRLHYSVDPGNPANSRIIDLKYAPKNAKGRVEFVGEFILLKPVDLQKGNHRMIFDVSNRGDLYILGLMNDALFSNDPSQPAHAGNGFLMREGYTLLWAAWNWDVRPGFNRMQVDLPIITIDGKPITREIAAEIVLIDTGEVSKCEPISWGDSHGYPAADIDDRSTARLTVRESPRGKRVLIPHSQWKFARLGGDQVVPDPTYVYLEPGFQPGKIYELIYIAKNPRVVGLGFAAARDAISFFRFNTTDRYNQPNPLINEKLLQEDTRKAQSAERKANNTIGAMRKAPCAMRLPPDPEKVYIFGMSQSGRFITHMIYKGFHVDEAGRMVIDGASIHVGGAGKGGFNHRFGINTNISLHFEFNYMPGDFFPFNFAPQEDPLTGQKGDVLAVAKKSGKIPYIMVVNNEAEYWTRSASLLHTDVLGKKDAPVHEKVRIYLTCGASHSAPSTRERGRCEHSLSVIDHWPVSRALLKALDRWVTEGIEPPPGSYPRIDRNELITAAQHKKQFPKIPGMRHPGKNLQPPRVNYGEKFRKEGIITVVPPEMGEPYITLVPNFDSDGNSIGGIRLPELRVPLGTYQGWNPRQAKYGAPEFLVPFLGSFWPFAITEAERKKNNDPRPSIEARYPSKKDYVGKVGKAVKDLIQQGFMLEEDGKKYIQDAKNMAWPPEPINQFPFWQQEKRIKEPKAIEVDPKIYDAYVGQYEIEAGAVITVIKENNSLFARVSEQQKFELFPESETKYFIKEAHVRVTFIKDEQGKVIQLLIHTDRGEMRAKKIK
jgi:hypothetical protein